MGLVHHRVSGEQAECGCPSCSVLWFQQDLAPQTRRDTSTSQILRSRLIVKRLMDWGGGFDPIMLYEGGAFGN